MSKKEKRFMPSYEDFAKSLKKKKIKLELYQEDFAKRILDSREVIFMLPFKSGKTWLFGLIDRYLSEELENFDG